ncbi:MAG: MFS transporter [Myxococcaceae bacterium]
MKLTPGLAFALQISMVISFLAGSSAPTPLYPTYQAAWGFSPVMLTVVFGTYAVSVLGALLVLGTLSDHVGRRPVLLVAAVLQAATMVLYVTATGVEGLIAARILQGISTGAAAAAVGAGLLDLDREKGALANALSPPIGTASGSLGAGLVVQFLPAPTQLVFALLGIVFVIQAVGVWMMTETAQKRPGVWQSLRPKLQLPAQVRGPMLIAVPALVAAWALPGFYGSLGPSLVRKLSGTSSPTLAGLALFVLAATGAITVYAARNRASREVLQWGTASLIAGVALTLVTVAQGAFGGFLIGTAIAGAGFGMTFQGAVRSVLPLAAAHQRAGVLSLLYVVAYLSMGTPAVIAGLRVLHGRDVAGAAQEYGAAVMALAAVAFAGVWVRRPAPVAATNP